MTNGTLNTLSWFAIISISMPIIALVCYLFKTFPMVGMIFGVVIIILMLSNFLGKVIPIHKEDE